MNTRTLLAFVAGLSVALSAPVLARHGAMFWDMGHDDYFTDAVENLSDLGVIKGFKDGSFRPGNPVTRAEVAVMFDRYDREVVEPLRKRINALDGDNGVRCEGTYRVGESYLASDGCNRCTCLESGVGACTKMACPKQVSKCLSSDQCRSGEYCTVETGDCLSPCDDPTQPCMAVCAGVCKARVSSASGVCGAEKQAFELILDKTQSCRTDEDCKVFISSCPLLTCGAPLSKANETAAQNAANAYGACMRSNNQPIACAMCMPVEVACVSGRCVKR
jgi:hypothetical protein